MYPCIYIAMPMKVEGAKIACLDFNLQKAKMHLGVSVIVTDPEKLDDIRQRCRNVYKLLLLFILLLLLFIRESDITKERVQKILSTGANVVLTTGGIDDLCLKYFVEAGAMAVRRCKKEDLKRIARATGGNLATLVT